MADLLPPHERYAAEVYAAVADMLRSNGNPLGFVETIATQKVTDVILTALDRCARLAARVRDSEDEPDAFFRVYGWEAGRILDAGDIADVQKVLGDFNDEIGANADRLASYRTEVLHEIGGPGLVAACDAEDKAAAERIIKRSLAFIAARTAKHREAAQ